jgi:putative ubiquitin-RnfH superfamily antitoxin RatB of RatAB toxin-antitoxin module
MKKTISIEIAYAKPDTQVLISLKVDEGTTIEEAITRSGILAQFPEIDLTHNKVGVFSKIVKLDTLLRDKDRIEIYRPLLADPKEIRRKRAEEGKTMKKGG